MRSFHKNNEGVSEIVGALMLIVIVIVAAAAVAYFVATTEEQDMNRQDLISSIHSEDLEIVAMQPMMINSSIDPGIAFQLVNANNASELYYVYYVNATQVTLLTANNASFDLPANIINGYYSQITNNMSASITNVSGTWEIELGAPGYVFQTAEWNSVQFNVRNLNIQSSYIHGIMVNNIWEGSWSSYVNGVTTQYGLNSPQGELLIPAGQSANITVALINPIPKTSSVNVQVETPYVNMFQNTISPPTAVASFGLTQQSYGSVSRDIYTLYGSSSSAQSGASIEQYIWRLDIPNANFTGNWNDPTTITTVFVNGNNIQYLPEDILGTTNFGNLSVTGPIRATLEVIDSNGLISFSDPVYIPEDTNIVPPYIITLASQFFVQNSSTTGNLTVNVLNIFGSGAANVPVVFTIVGGDSNSGVYTLSLDPQVVLTSPEGTASIFLSWNTTTPNPSWEIEVSCLNLQPIDIKISP